jgi:hypothetical protein
MELINCKRGELSEQCFWTINNFLLSERGLASPLIQFGICKSIKKTFEDIKNKSIELLTEMFWTLNYLLDFDESSVQTILKQIPTLVRNITSQLEYEDERLE